MARLAIIPARGGSKRIPRKNVREFAGKPIMAYSIHAALESNLFDEVMVSTDDVGIAQLALQHGAAVPFLRSRECADDFATTADVVLEVLATYKKQNRTFDAVCCIYATAPFATAQLLEKCYRHLQQGGFDSVFPLVQFDYPIQRSLEFGKDGRVSMVWPEFERSRSQDLTARFHDSGLFYWLRTEKLEEHGQLIGDNSGGIAIGSLECHDIDTVEDWDIAEMKFMRVKRKEKNFEKKSDGRPVSSPRKLSR